MKTKTGATGTFSVSFGTSLTGNEWTVGCEGGSVSVSRSTITTVINGKEEEKEVQDEGSGVSPEVRKWGEALVAGSPNERQSPEEALADLELAGVPSMTSHAGDADCFKGGEHAEKW